MNQQDLYAIIGEDGFHRLVAAFYRRVPDDDILGPMYPSEDLAGAEQRLRCRRTPTRPCVRSSSPSPGC